MPRSVRESWIDERSSTRSTTDSPCCVGNEDTRMSTGRPSHVVMIRPSCGTRRSAMFMFAITFTREMIEFAR